MKKKLTITEFKVQSFVTAMEQRSAHTAKGGKPEWTHEWWTECGEVCMTKCDCLPTSPGIECEITA